MNTHDEHKSAAPKSIGCAVITCSDTRTAESDVSGQLIQRLLKEQGHSVASYHVVKDDPSRLQLQIALDTINPAVQVIIMSGGTGIAKRDSTFESVDAMLEKRLEGFGQLFRMLSYQEIGSAAIMTRATAGTISGRVIFSLPGSEHAVRLGMEKLILPELGHLVQQLTK
ncbi:MAG: molybdenum cofactor biosynthesis protein MoaB [Nitrospira sp.]|nr:molybdenum cofactor biosynthesis protein MoaB [Nitrospira sp.]